jgi:hypothetical protein
MPFQFCGQVETFGFRQGFSKEVVGRGNSRDDRCGTASQATGQGNLIAHFHLQPRQGAADPLRSGSSGPEEEVGLVFGQEARAHPLYSDPYPGC